MQTISKLSWLSTNLQEVAVNPGLVLKVIDGLKGVYRWNSTISEAKKQVPEFGRELDMEQQNAERE